MGNWKAAFPSSYLKSADVEQPKLLTIKEFGTEDLNGEIKPVLHFNEDSRGLVLNVTNGNSIERIAGSADTDNWIGVQVVLYAAETEFGGKTVPCIRVRAPKAKTSKPVQRPAAPRPEDIGDEDVPF